MTTTRIKKNERRDSRLFLAIFACMAVGIVRNGGNARKSR